MEKTAIQIYLDGQLPLQYREPAPESKEVPVKDVEELSRLYEVKYGSFGEVTFYIYREHEKEVFIKGLNDLFKDQNIDMTVDEKLLKENLEKFVPLIIVNGEIVSRGTYPDLTTMRGGHNSVNRGGTGGHEEH